MKITRWRYVLFEVLTEEDLTEQELVSTIWKQIYTISGLVGGSKAGFKMLKYNSNEKRGIARISWLYLDDFRIVLATLNMQKKNLHVNEILVSGTQAALTRKSINCKSWLKTKEKIDELKNIKV